MMVNDFDDEQTLEEEESLAAKEMQDPNAELTDLQKEGEMPIEELLKLYGAPSASFAPSSTGTSRKRRRRGSPPPVKSPEIKESLKEIEAVPSTPVVVTEEVAEESPDEDATTTTTTNNLENQSLDDETNYDEEEPSELKKLYTGMYDKDAKDGGLKLDQSLSDEEDLDYSPDEDETKKTIMVGGDYQAQIPEGLCKYDDALPYENEDKLLWDPTKLSDSDIEDYLNKFSTLASANGGVNFISQGGKHLRDDEQALHLLLQCGNNCEEALRRRRLGGAQPATTMSIWSEEECRNFEGGLRLYGKCFHEIQASKVTPDQSL
jgi:ELM2 domain